MKPTKKDIGKANRRGNREAWQDMAKLLQDKIHTNKKKYNRKKIIIEYDKD